MSLSVYNGKVFLNDNPWEKIVIKDELYGTNNEIYLEDNMYLGIRDTNDEIETHPYYDEFLGTYWELFMYDGKIGLSIVSDEYVSFNNECGQTFFRVGNDIPIKLLNKVNDEIIVLYASIISTKTWDLYEASFSNLEKIEDGIFEIRTKIFEDGEYLLRIGVENFGFLYGKIIIKSDNMINCNEKLENISEMISTMSSVGYL